MSSVRTGQPLQIGGLLRSALREVRERIYSGVVEAGFDDLGPAHVTLFRWPGPDGVRPTELAASTDLSKQTVNGLLRDLERREYLRLDVDETDGRARIIRLTPKGKRLHRAAIRAHSEVEEDWADRLGRRRLDELRRLLTDLAETR